ncbi:hypothetical protein FA15DRAFT_671669 [Coprinopsis marcescibilis]|uniref:Pal1-domain-containing protein n=1 Tax=Coprinopsis marcescibilis TaxID=230819 RepID=A0A5C3KPN8_COPMA|nr:hypothetical protein FA15DRAFT_671669 [Coprinopsis marcescibilis]
MRDGFLRNPTRSQQTTMLAAGGSFPARHTSSNSRDNAIIDGPSPEDYARWNDVDETQMQRHYLDTPEMPPASPTLDDRERTTSFSERFPYPAGPAPDPRAPRPNLNLQHAPRPTNKLRRRTVSVPTASPPGASSSVVHHHGEDPLKRMKYDLQITTVLLNKLKMSSNNNVHASYNQGGHRGRPRPMSYAHGPLPHRDVDPRNLLDPRIDGRRCGSEFHQIHNHGLLLDPYAVETRERRASSSSAHVSRSTSRNQPASSASQHQHQHQHQHHHSQSPSYSQPDPIARAKSSHQRPRSTSHYDPPALSHPQPEQIKHRQSDPRDDEEEVLFGNFREAHDPLRNVPKPPPRSGTGLTSLYNLEPRKVRFRGADSVIGSPNAMQQAFPSPPVVPRSHGSRSPSRYH